MMDFLWDFRYVIVAIAATGVWSAFEWTKAKDIAHGFIINAKSLAKDGFLNTGKEQEDWVVEKVLLFMPATLKLFVNESMVRALVQNLYKAAKDMLDDGKLNNSAK